MSLTGIELNPRLEGEAAFNSVPSPCSFGATPSLAHLPKRGGWSTGWLEHTPVSQSLGSACGATSLWLGDCQDPQGHRSTKRNGG